MAVSLSRLFADSAELYSIKMIAGKSGIDSLVRWVHIIEDSEVTGFIHGGELIFTTGITHSSNEWITDFAMMLRDHGAVGIVFNLGPYITSIPQKAIDLCDELGFPMFTIPWEKRLIDITFDYCHRIIANEEHEAGLAYAFRNLIFNPSDASGYTHTLSRRGFPENGLYTVLAVQSLRGKETVHENEWHSVQFEIETALKSIELHLFMFIQQSNLVIVMMNYSTYSEKQSMLNMLETALKTTLDADEIHIGISEEKRGYQEIPICYRQALNASSMAGKSGRAYVNYADMGTYKLLYSVNDQSVLREYYENILGAVQHHDHDHGTDYMTLLKNYIKMDCSVQAVSQAMGIHRNTVNYKIKLLRQTFGFDFSNENISDIVVALACMDIVENRENN